MRSSDEIIDLIRTLREKKGISQQSLADKVNVPKSSLSRYESKQRKFPVNNIGSYARALNVTSEYLLGLESEPKIDFSDTVSIPLYSSISCGDLSSIDNELLEYVEVPGMLKQRFGDNLFAIVAKGDSMDKKVPDGHIAVFAQGVQWENGDAVAVIVNGEEATMKNITKLQTSIVLEPDSTNPEHSAIMIDCNKVSCDDYVKVIGRLVFMYKDF